MLLQPRTKYLTPWVDGGGKPKCHKGGRGRVGNGTRKSRTILWHLNKTARKLKAVGAN